MTIDVEKGAELLGRAVNLEQSLDPGPDATAADDRTPATGAAEPMWGVSFGWLGDGWRSRVVGRKFTQFARNARRWLSRVGQLLALARERRTNRLSAAITRTLADGGETDKERDSRLHEARSVTTWTAGDGVTVVRIVFAPWVVKPVVAAVDELVRCIARLPRDDCDSFAGPSVTADVTERDQNPSAGAPGRSRVARASPTAVSGRAAWPNLFAVTLLELQRRWQPGDGTSTTHHAILRQLD
jgi:hypothetical protein